MQITATPHDDLLELRVAGRLDAEWADTLQTAIDNGVRQGYHAVVLDLSQVAYLSSAGLSVLVHAHRQLQEIRGFFGVGGVKGPAEEIIRLTGLAKLLLCDLDQVRRARGRGRSTISLPSRVASSQRADFEIYDLDPTAKMTCRAVGDPAKFDRGVYTANDVAPLTVTENTFALGHGAFGNEFAETSRQFGELIAVAGAVAVQPTGGASRPDYQVTQGDFIPQAQLLSGLCGTGTPAWLLRFDADDRERPLALTDLVAESLTQTGTSAAMCILLAETTGLVGAALRKSPASPPASSRFDHPEVRDWLSFSPEHVHPHTLAVIVGVVMRATDSAAHPSLLPLLRPMNAAGQWLGHFHAAVFPFQPFKKRRLELSDSVLSLFDAGQLQALLHLLPDERPISGAGESEFLRGACWVGPLATGEAAR